MNFHVLTLFPEMVMGGLNTSITGRAIESGHISIEAVNIRDFSTNKHKKVDDYPYGGGAGMLMQAQPVFDAYKSVEDRIPAGNKKRVIYVTPQGYPFTQRMAEDFAKSDDLIFLCGHYEGIDERVLEEVVTDYVSIGDYVLTGGELAAMVMIDAISRLVPGVLHNEVSAETESFHGELLEHPQYSRPEVWHEKKVPEVLLSGNQKKIDAWRIEESIKRTKARRPDLYEKYMALQECKAVLLKQKLLHMDMIELINRGRAVLVAKEEEKILLKDKDTDIFYYAGDTEEFLQKLPESVQNSIETLVLHEKDLASTVKEAFDLREVQECYHAVYTQKERLSITGLYRADGQPTESGLVIRQLMRDDYRMIADLKQEETAYMYGAFVEGKLAGYIGIHTDGRIGMLYVFEEYRGRKIAKALETYIINLTLELGWTPYGTIPEDNTPAIKLQESLGIPMSKAPVVWLKRE